MRLGFFRYTLANRILHIFLGPVSSPLPLSLMHPFYSIIECRIYRTQFPPLL